MPDSLERFLHDLIDRCPGNIVERTARELLKGHGLPQTPAPRRNSFVELSQPRESND